MNEVLAIYDIIILIAASLILIFTVKYGQPGILMFITGTLVVVQLVSVGYTRFLVTKFWQEFPLYADHVFYMVFAMLDVAAIYAIYFIHKRKSIQVNLLSIVSVLIYSAFVGLQLSRFMDRQLRFNKLEAVYSYGIPALNTCLITLLLVFAVIEYRNKKLSRYLIKDL
tara:strand:+ start:648 stop:1151 length:504 start_codon:yes stop_codon:yes gene_type:complete